MNDLADKIEALEGPSREVDAEIERELAIGCQWTTPARYTASSDAAMTLVPEWYVAIHKWVYPDHASVAIFGDEDGDNLYRGRGRTEALALCAAALRARQETNDG